MVKKVTWRDAKKVTATLFKSKKPHFIKEGFRYRFIPKWEYAL